MTTQANVNDVNIALCKALGIDWKGRQIKGFTLTATATELPTLVVSEYLPTTNETVKQILKLRLAPAGDE